jgi:molybdopterin-containing oxidoreductase family iron-sulfur binding subunit
MSSMNHDQGSADQYWRSLDHLADTPEFQAIVQREFPEHASEMTNPITRRNFLSLMGASLAFAGLAGCRRPVEKIIPYVVKPEEIVPGVAQRFATALPFGTTAYGLVVTTHEGRPTRVDGHPAHPGSLGAAHAFMQASILNLYDPDRSKTVLKEGKESSWPDFVSAWRDLYAAYIKDQGAGLAVLSESFASPTLARLRGEFLRAFPRARWATYEPVSDENIFEGLRLATGTPLQPVYRYDRAKVILSLEADLLYSGTDSVSAARGFSNGRRIKTEQDSMNRLYVAESTFTVTGSAADHRLRLPSGHVTALAVAVARELTAEGAAVEGVSGVDVPSGIALDRAWIQAVAKDLVRARGAGIVVAGYQQPPEVHALVYAMNRALQNEGSTMVYREIKDASLPNRSELAALVHDMNSANVTSLVILGGNPAYDAPADLNFGSALSNVRTTIHFSTHADETSRLCLWHVPQSHFLESWGDVRAADGTLSVVQPMVEPLFGAHSSIELLSLLTTGTEVSGYESVRATWSSYFKAANFEQDWRRVLHDGLLADSALPAVSPKVNGAAIAGALKAPMAAVSLPGLDNMEIVFRPSASTFDGRYANNGWLQELPDPITKVAWDNVALISATTAKELKLSQGLRDGQNYQPMLRLQYQGREIDMPIWIQPGQADYTVTVALGYGRRAAGRIGDGVGVNAYALRTSTAPYFDGGLRVARLDRTYPIASVQDHGGLETETLASNEIGRRAPTILREASLEQYRKNPDFASNDVVLPGFKDLKDKDGEPVSIYDAHAYDKGYQWGMSIDLNACIGCNACTVACQSENNIPVVGKEQVLMGREMHWIRLDRYYKGAVDDPDVAFQPVACQHCENAPCEQVCPVAATVHDKEGLNVMVYNRCVGTRYCANNCPYKVRRFNFLEFNPGTSGFVQEDGPEILKLAKNPDVTVRMRGVMEKCTYCVQRISGARIAAKKERREIRDGEVVTACQQTCPTQAIVFGNLNDPESRVARIKKANRDYELLAELNVRPRTSYLARLRNPNPDLEQPTAG